MQRLLFFILFISGQTLFGQNFQSSSLSYTKGTPIVINSTSAIHPVISSSVVRGETDLCNCWIERDSTWQVVPFDGSGGSGGPGLPPEYRNDDWSTAPITLPFSYCFYGMNYTSVYINNNGNISFDGPYSTYTADSFPSGNFKMIAPFWSDVDTRGPLSGVVYYKVTSTALFVQWDHVGYFGVHDDLLNTYQLIITDGTDPILDAGKNVQFCYQDMQWTTGDASSGLGGFGGLPATVGTNPGDGINSIQVGRYNQTGIVYDGPYGGADGVDMLDNRSFSFSVCNATNVTPFLKEASLCDTFELCVGDTSLFRFEFYSPEQAQTTSAAFNFFGMSGCSTYQNTPGNIVSITASIIGELNNTGYHAIDVTATDNGNPQQSATTTFVVHVKSIDPNFTFSPSTVHAGDTITFYSNATNPSISVWHFDDGSPDTLGAIIFHVFDTDGIFNITQVVTDPDCQRSDSSTQMITVLPVGVFDLNATLMESLSPNPTTGMISIRSKNNTEKFSLHLFDLQGRIVLEKINFLPEEVIDISKFDSGVYFYLLSNSKGSKVGKVIKQ